MNKKMQSTIVDDLSGNPLISSLFSNLKPTLSKLYKDVEWYEDPKTNLFRPKVQPKLSREDTYNWNILSYAAALLDAITRLEECQIYLSHFPRPRFYEKYRITEDRWIYYHYSVYLVTAVSIYDPALLLVNTVFSLGLDPRECNDRTVTNNEWVKPTKVNKALSGLKKVIDDYRSLRHKYIHRNEVPRLNFLQINEMLSLSQRLDNPFMESKKVDRLYDEFTEIFVDELKEKTNQIANAVKELFDSLFSEYKLRASIHQKSEELGKTMNEIMGKA